MSLPQQVFNYEEKPVRIAIVDGEPWFVAKDVCNILGIGNAAQAITRLDEDEKGVISNDTLGGTQGLLHINESGLYSLVLGSKKPEAKEFKRWVTHEVIPSIRKHGAYMTAEVIEKTLSDPDFIIGLATQLKEERQQRILAEQTIEEQKPKVLFAQAVETSKDSVLIGELAKVLKQNGIEIGQNRLFAWLRDNGYLCNKGELRNIPTQRSMEAKLFEIKKSVVHNYDGSIKVVATSKVTPKGQIFFVNKFLDREKIAQ